MFAALVSAALGQDLSLTFLQDYHYPLNRGLFNEAYHVLKPELADLVLTKRDSPDPVTAGSNLTYTITITNNGPSTATGVTLTDTLPSSVAFVSAVPSQGSCSHTSGIVTCDLGTIKRYRKVTVSIVVIPTTAGTMANTASVSSNETDPNMNNNSATVTTSVLIPDLAGRFTKLSITCRGGSRPRYQIQATLKIQNNGNGEVRQAFLVKYYLSNDGSLDGGDLLLRSRRVTSRIRPGSSINLSETFNLTSCPQGKYLIAVLDAENAINEQDEMNNVVIGGPLGLASASSAEPPPLMVEFRAEPNPTRGSAPVRFSALGTRIIQIQVEIFNLAGLSIFQAVANGNQLLWDLVDSSGTAVANGVYLYIITVRGYDGQVIKSEVRKLVVLR
jgi:uncharacterized repeat protein (TIGR01451 family)